MLVVLFEVGSWLVVRYRTFRNCFSSAVEKMSFILWTTIFHIDLPINLNICAPVLYVPTF